MLSTDYEYPSESTCASWLPRRSPRNEENAPRRGGARRGAFSECAGPPGVQVKVRETPGVPLAPRGSGESSRKYERKCERKCERKFEKVRESTIQLETVRESSRKALLTAGAWQYLLRLGGRARRRGGDEALQPDEAAEATKPQGYLIAICFFNIFQNYPERLQTSKTTALGRLQNTAFCQTVVPMGTTF